MFSANRYDTQLRLNHSWKQPVSRGGDALRAIEKELKEIGDNINAGIKNQESGVVIDLFLSYRAVKAWKDMTALVDKMSTPLAVTVMVQEQLALAMNRDGQGEKAERVFMDLIDRRGTSSETYGILGRVYKDRWETALKSGDRFMARGAARQGD